MTLDSLLWRFRWYRRRVMKRSGVWTALMQKPLTLRQVYPPHDPLVITPLQVAMLDDAVHDPLVREFDRMSTTYCENLERSLETPAILTRGPRSFLEPRRVGSWPLGGVCGSCNAGDHGMYSRNPCSCPCHGKGAA